MKRFKNVLFFADGSDVESLAFDRAVALARSNEARLTVIDVIEPVATPAEVVERFSVELDDLLRQRRLGQLEAIVAGTGDAGVDVRVMVLIGVGFIEVIRAVLSDDYDLVIKVAQGPQDFTDRLFGSTDMHLLRKCPCPVWIDRPVEKHYETIIAAVDPKGATDPVSRLVMDLATSMAQREGARVHVVHAWYMEGESLLREGHFRLPERELISLQHTTETRHRDALADVLAHYQIPIDASSVHLVKGRAAPVIRDTAEQLSADLIVMGTVGRTGIPGFFIGNTAEEVLQTTSASVLAVKPADFVSPVS